jgi:hypothetical protein
MKVNLGAAQWEVGRWKLEREPRICTGGEAFSEGQAEVTETASDFRACMQQPAQLRAARLWLFWNLQIESFADARFRVEDTNPRHVCELAQFTSCHAHPDSSSDSETNKRRTREASEAVFATRSDASALNLAASWEGLKTLDGNLEADVRQMALRYGYKPDPSDHPQASFLRAR